MLHWSLRRFHTVSAFSALPLLCLLAVGCGQSPPQQVSFTESFDGNSYDESKWQLAKPNESVGTVEVVDDGLLITAPPSDQSRPQIRNSSTFSMSGDFEVSMDFDLLTPLPAPQKNYVNLEFVIAGVEGVIHFSRANHLGSGNGCVVYYTPTDKSAKSIWKHSPTTDMKGTLKFVRKGDQVDCLFQGAGSSTPKVISSVPFGAGAVRNVLVALAISTPTSETVKVRVDNLTVQTTQAAGGNNLASIVGGLSVGFFVILGAVLFLVWKSRKPSSSSSAPPEAAAE